MSSLPSSSSSSLSSSSPDARAQKRAALGLSPRRPTAKSTVVRPPDPPRGGRSLFLLPVGLIAIMGLTIFLMLGAGNRLAGFTVRADTAWTDFSWARLTPPDSPLATPTGNAPANIQTSSGVPSQRIYDSPTTAETARAGANEQALPAPRMLPNLLIADTFALPQTIFAVGDAPGQWRTEHIPQQAIYRMEIWPNHVAWSLLEPEEVFQDVYVSGDVSEDEGGSGVRIQTAVTLAAHTAWGFGGLTARVQEGQQLILFLVDGSGHFSVQIMREGEAEFVVPWTRADALNPAGTGNVLTIEDDGDTMRFFGNQFPLFQMRVSQWGPGKLGIAAGASSEGIGEARFEWFQLYTYALPDGP